MDAQNLNRNRPKQVFELGFGSFLTSAGHPTQKTFCLGCVSLPETSLEVTGKLFLGAKKAHKDKNT